MPRVLAVDWGERRIRLAVCDPTGTIASGLDTLIVHSPAEGVRRVLEAIAEVEADSGRGRAAAAALGRARRGRERRERLRRVRARGLRAPVHEVRRAAHLRAVHAPHARARRAAAREGQGARGPGRRDRAARVVAHAAVVRGAPRGGTARRGRTANDDDTTRDRGTEAIATPRRRPIRWAWLFCSSRCSRPRTTAAAAGLMRRRSAARSSSSAASRSTRSPGLQRAGVIRGVRLPSRSRVMHLDRTVKAGQCSFPLGMTVPRSCALDRGMFGLDLLTLPEGLGPNAVAERLGETPRREVRRASTRSRTIARCSTRSAWMRRRSGLPRARLILRMAARYGARSRSERWFVARSTACEGDMRFAAARLHAARA